MRRERSGAGHQFHGAYRVYGEGSIHHNGHPCQHGLELDRHPLIFRHDWPSRWAYERAQVANWWFTGHVIHRMEFGDHEVTYRYSWLDKAMRRLFGPPFPRVPTVDAGLRPEDSVYDRSEWKKEV